MSEAAHHRCGDAACRSVKPGDHVTVFVRNRDGASYRSRGGTVVAVRRDVPDDWIDVQFDSDLGGEARGFYLARYVSKDAS